MIPFLKMLEAHCVAAELVGQVMGDVGDLFRKMVGVEEIESTLAEQ